MSKGIAVMTRRQALLVAAALVLLVLLGLAQLRHGQLTPPSAFAAAQSTSFAPTLVSLSAGSAATVTVTTLEVDAGVDGAQFNIQHPSFLEVTSPQCTGIFAGGTPTGPSAVAGGTLIGCFLLSGNVKATSGDAMTFTLTKKSAASETVLAFGLGGGFGTSIPMGAHQ